MYIYGLAWVCVLLRGFSWVFDPHAFVAGDTLDLWPTFICWQAEFSVLCLDSI